MKTDPHEARLWIVNRIAEVLADLADDDDPDTPDPDELFDQFKNVAEIILEAVEFEVISSDGKKATATFGDG
jgi:ABC-type uncharacterized transport system substrate-binding protein